ncbi:MAG: winged helix-turn-helix transcriptional regulator [Cognatishimia sp.]
MAEIVPTQKKAAVPLDECGLAAVAEIIGDRWKLLIIREVFYGVRRFDDIRSDIGIPRSVLSQRLAALVTDGLLDRKTYQEAGQRARAEYHFSASGRDLLLPLAALWQWSYRHTDRQSTGLALQQKSTGAKLMVGLVPVDGRIPPDDIAVEITRARSAD